MKTVHHLQSLEINNTKVSRLKNLLSGSYRWALVVVER